MWSKWIVTVIAILLVALGVDIAWPDGETAPHVSPEFRALSTFAEATRGSVLSAGSPAVEYILPPSASTVRILTNANLRSLNDARIQRRADSTRRWQYAIEVEELDAQGHTLNKREQHFQRDLVEVKMPGGRGGTGVFYLDERSPAPLPAAHLILSFPAGSRPSRLRVRVVTADADIADLLVRVAVPPPESQRTADIVWRRLSNAQREQLASGNVFPPAVLTEQERASLIASRWMPLGPVEASESRDIYVLKGEDTGAPVDAPVPVAPMIRPNRAVTIQLPEKGGRMRIVLDAESNGKRTPEEVTVRWIGHSAFLRRTSRYTWSGDRFVLQEDFGGGWLEISSTRSASVRAAEIKRGQETDITPPVGHLRTWLAQKDAPLDFSVSHVSNAATPFRLVLRRTGKDAEATADVPVNVSFLGDDGAVIRAVTLHPQFMLSRYDAPWPDIAGQYVSDPWEAFFRLPAAVRKIRITSAIAVLANAYSRPENLPREIRMPEDVHVPESAKTAIPGWFMLNPDGYRSRILDGSSSLLVVQSRLPEERPELPAGQYQWEDFDPVADASARIFLAPREEGVPDRKDAISATFRPIAASSMLDFAAAPGHTMVAPRLAWAARTARTLHYKIMIDGKEWHRGAATGIAGEVALPPFVPGRHHVRIESDDAADWYANHLERGKPWVKRRAYRLTGPLSFEVERTTLEQEFISVRLFRPARLGTRTKLRVKISAPNMKDAIGPFAGWLFTEREYDIRPGGQFALPVAETDAEKIDVGQPFYIPLPLGASRGRYRVTLTPEDASSWITMSRIAPGVGTRTALFLESVLDE